MSSFCKPNNCNFVYPIKDTECLGNSLSTVNLNFVQLDTEMCRVEDKINTSWNPAFNVFANLSAKWLDAMTIMGANSAFWEQTNNTIRELSAFWLKPITLIYPYPFETTTDINIIKTWLNENFPVKNSGCFNFIVGQELYIHSPEYLTINRIINGNQSAGIKQAVFTYTCDCIGKGRYTGNAITNVDCGGVTLNLNVPDQYINKFVGLKFTVNDSFEWSDGVKIFG